MAIEQKYNSKSYRTETPPGAPGVEGVGAWEHSRTQCAWRQLSIYSVTLCSATPRVQKPVGVGVSVGVSVDVSVGFGLGRTRTRTRTKTKTKTKRERKIDENDEGAEGGRGRRKSS